MLTTRVIPSSFERVSQIPSLILPNMRIHPVIPKIVLCCPSLHGDFISGISITTAIPLRMTKLAIGGIGSLLTTCQRLPNRWMLSLMLAVQSWLRIKNWLKFAVLLEKLVMTLLKVISIIYRRLAKPMKNFPIRLIKIIGDGMVTRLYGIQSAHRLMIS